MRDLLRHVDDLHRYGREALTTEPPQEPDLLSDDNGHSGMYADEVEGESGAPTPGVVPALPSSLSLPDPAPCEWLDRYMAYARGISPMTPALFHEGAGLWLAGVVTARRLVLRMAFGDVYPNLWVLWLAPTTLYRKSTALAVAEGIAQEVTPHLLAPNETTPEAMLSDLAGKEPTGFERMTRTEIGEWEAERNYSAQRGLLLDEISGLLASFGRDYNAGLMEALLRMYDCAPRYVRSTRGQGRVTVRNAYLSILGGSTPAALAPHLGSERLWSNGFWPRFALLCPEHKPAWEESQAVERPREVLAGLRRLYERLPEATYPEPPKALAVSLGAGSYEVWAAYNKALSFDLLGDGLDGRLFGTYGRLPTLALKAATILAALDWPEGQVAPVIEAGHLGQGIRITERWRASAHRVLEQIAGQQGDALHERIIRQVAGAGSQGISLRDLSRSLRDRSPGELERAVQELLGVEEIEVVQVRPGPRGGRPTKRFRLAGERQEVSTL